ncbi:MAG: hypothetical protein OCD02_16760 [Spirochaetaceae bacterium]
MTSNENVLKTVKFSIMLIMSLVIIIKPNSLLSIMLFVLGGYMVLIGIYALISFLALIKYKKGWVPEGLRFLILTTLGCLLLFNSTVVAGFLSGAIFVVLGLLIMLVGVVAIARTKETSAGIIFLIVGFIIAIFPLGVSFFVTRIIGFSLLFLSVYLLVSLKTKSS